MHIAQCTYLCVCVCMCDTLSAMAARFSFVVVLAALFIVALATPAESVKVTISLDQLVEFKQGFVIAGNISTLGNWAVSAAPLMDITGTSHWFLVLDLPARMVIAFKPVLVYYDTKDLICWSGGNDIVLTVTRVASTVVLPTPFTCDSLHRPT